MYIACSITRLLPRCSTCPYSLGQLLEDLNRGFPIDASIGDTNALFESRRPLCWYLLVSFIDVRFDHHTDYGLLAFAKLIAYHLRNFGLVTVVLIGVAYLH